jgi:hypothetical protein
MVNEHDFRSQSVTGLQALYSISVIWNAYVPLIRLPVNHDAMTKKDADVSLDIKREEAENPSPAGNAPCNGEEINRTEVKNAHATGDGSIGRNDQKTEVQKDFNNY